MRGLFKHSIVAVIAHCSSAAVFNSLLTVIYILTGLSRSKLVIAMIQLLSITVLIPLFPFAFLHE